MPFKIQCPNCGRTLRVPERLSGKRVTCPGCQNPLTIPEEEVLDAEVDSPSSPEDPVDAETYGVTSPSSRSDSSSGRERDESSRRDREENDRRPCPMCGEMIPVEAAKCRFCREIFDPELRRMEEKKKKKKKRASASDDDLSAGEWVVAILCSWIGCICGIVWIIQGKPKGSKMFGVSLLFTLLWGGIRAVIENAKR
jgi:hypothetical protein